MMDRLQLVLVLCLISLAPSVQAKDVSAQQAGVEYARQEIERAEAQNKSDLDDVAAAEKLLEQRKRAFELQTKQLADDRKKAELSKKRLQEAKLKYNKAQALLDQAWKE